MLSEICQKVVSLDLRTALNVCKSNLCKFKRRHLQPFYSLGVTVEMSVRPHTLDSICFLVLVFLSVCNVIAAVEIIRFASNLAQMFMCY